MREGRSARDRHELHRLHPKRVIHVRTNPPVRRAAFGVNLGGGAPPVAAPSPIEDDLDVVFAGESRPDVVVESRMITRNDQQVADGAPAGCTAAHGRFPHDVSSHCDGRSLRALTGTLSPIGLPPSRVHNAGLGRDVK